MRKFSVAPILAFIAPVILSAIYTFAVNRFDRGLIWDSAHYLLSSNALLHWLGEWAGGHYIDPKTIDLGSSILVDGPVLPAFGAIFIGLAALFKVSSEVAILSGQSLVCGLNSFLLYCLARRFGAGRKLSLATAWTLGFNPATIITASQFLTEQLTATTLLTFTWLLTQALPKGRLNASAEDEKKQTGDNPTFYQYGAYVGLGAAVVLVLHLKTALFPTVALVVLLAGLARKNNLRLRANIVVALAMGAFFALLPWLTFSKLASPNGKMSLAPNRVPSINLAVGMDLESDAWGVAPPTASVMPIIFDKPSAIAVSLWHGDELKMSALFARKLERLFAYSWDDFGWSYFGLSWLWQCLLQRMLLCAALLGTIYLLIQEKLLNNRLTALSNVDFLKLTALLIVAGHLIFIPFEAQPRYGYSAVPFLILLASVGAQKLRKAQIIPFSFMALSFLVALFSLSDPVGPLYTLTRNLATAELIDQFTGALLFAGLLNAAVTLALGGTEKKPTGSSKRIAILLSTSTAIAMAFLHLANLNNPPPEWQWQMKPGQSANREIEIPRSLALAWQRQLPDKASTDGEKNNWAALLIDGDQNLASASIKVNGVRVDARPPSTILDVEQAYQFQQTIKELSDVAARTKGQEENTLRQWRLVQIPLKVLDLDSGKNKIEVEAVDKPLKIYGQYAPEDRDAKSRGKGKLYLPSLYGFSALRLFILDDSRTVDRLTNRYALSHCRAGLTAESGNLPAQGANSQEDLAPGLPGLQTGDYRIYLLLAHYQGDGKKSPATKEPAMTFKNVYSEIF